MSRIDRRVPMLEKQLDQANARYDALVARVVDLGFNPREPVVAAEQPAPAWPAAVMKAIADTGLDARTQPYRALMTWVAEAIASDVAEHEIVQKIKRGWSEELEDTDD